MTLINNTTLDIYETLVIDKNYKVSKIKLYFNNYIVDNQVTIALPQNFKIDTYDENFKNCSFVEAHKI